MNQYWKLNPPSNDVSRNIKRLTGENATILYHVFFYFVTKIIVDYFNKNNMSLRKYFFLFKFIFSHLLKRKNDETIPLGYHKHINIFFLARYFFEKNK